MWNVSSWLPLWHAWHAETRLSGFPHLNRRRRSGVKPRRRLNVKPSWSDCTQVYLTLPSSRDKKKRCRRWRWSRSSQCCRKWVMTTWYRQIINPRHNVWTKGRRRLKQKVILTYQSGGDGFSGDEDAGGAQWEVMLIGNVDDLPLRDVQDERHYRKL